MMNRYNKSLEHHPTHFSPQTATRGALRSAPETAS